ncbi:MAG TPA: hypothetical protein VNQ76_17465 [Planctomicrobium sp.]|nr:hypothetical protein [Planctomicrobium sp.]
MPFSRSVHHWLAVIVALLPFITGAGCQLLLPGAEELVSGKSPLKPIVAPREVIDLEVYYVDRSIGDPLIGDSLWRSLSPISSLAAESGKRLTEDGFRYAMAPSRPPRNLQSLLSLSNDQDPSRRVVPHRYSVPSGQETMLMISNPPDGTPLSVKSDDVQKSVQLSQAQCLFRLSARRVDEGWVALSMTPEIRHGANTLRPVAMDQDWQYREQQQTLTFYQHRLAADVNVGEVIVLGLEPTATDSVASRFFRADLTRGVERLILIRVVSMRSVDPVRAGQE